MDWKMNSAQEYIFKAMWVLQELYMVKTSHVWPKTENSLFIHRWDGRMIVTKHQKYNFVVEYGSVNPTTVCTDSYKAADNLQTFESDSDIQVMNNKQLMHTLKDVFGADVDPDGNYLGAVLEACSNDIDYRSDIKFWRLVLFNIWSAYRPIVYSYPKKYPAAYLDRVERIIDRIVYNEL